MEGNVLLKLEHVNKTIGKRPIIKDLSFETYEGEVFGFLGPNGAGKTTTIKMIVGLLSIDSGKITICDKNIENDFEEAMKNIGAIVENPEMYNYMSGLDNLKQYARMRENVSKERIDEVVQIVGLNNRINDKVKSYSLGMKQRLGLAQTMLHQPKVLILDEPTNGLDPAGIKQLRDILKKMAHENKCSVIISSHLMSEMELMCDRIGIIVNGQLKDVKTIEQMLSEERNNIKYRIEVGDVTKAKECLESIDIEKIFVNDRIVEFYLSTNLEIDDDDRKNMTIPDIVRLFVENNIDIYSLNLIKEQSLEEAFIELTESEGEQIE